MELAETPIQALTAKQDSRGGLLMTCVETAGHDVQLGGQAIAGDDAAHSLTIPAGTEKIVMIPVGGSVRFDFSGATATASSPGIITTGGMTGRFSAGDALSVYVPTGVTLNVTYWQRV